MDARILNLLVDEGTRWVLGQREAHRSRGLPLDGLSRQKVAPFFDRATLDGMRVRAVIRIESPDFYTRPEMIGLPRLDFSGAAGITFGDTVCLPAGRTAGLPPKDLAALLFHELVHVCQYRTLGVRGFVREYVDQGKTDFLSV